MRQLEAVRSPTRDAADRERRREERRLELLPNGQTAALVRELAVAAYDVLGEAPTIDFALVAVARALRLPNGAALTLFALGRTIGWIGHAIEQYEKNEIIRPRAKYVGVAPAAATTS